VSRQPASNRFKCHTVQPQVFLTEFEHG
jgi:hypothetical protein